MNDLIPLSNTLDELKALDEAATPGPWRGTLSGDGKCYSIHGNAPSYWEDVDCAVDTDDKDRVIAIANANTILAARNNLAALLQRARAYHDGCALVARLTDEKTLALVRAEKAEEANQDWQDWDADHPRDGEDMRDYCKQLKALKAENARLFAAIEHMQRGDCTQPGHITAEMQTAHRPTYGTCYCLTCGLERENAALRVRVEEFEAKTLPSIDVDDLYFLLTEESEGEDDAG